MGITFRSYESPQDIDLKQEFWVETTRPLPWCWKPTISPVLYSRGKQFGPRSRVFAFDNGRLIRYCSFTGQGEFVSLGYPWVLPGFEGELQEQLFDSVWGFAASDEYGGRVFAQRFRQHWTAQISFFERHGFSVQRRDPIYATDLRARLTGLAPSAVTCFDQFRWDEFRPICESPLPEAQLDMWRQYFETVDFDFAVRAVRDMKPLAYIGIAVRGDTGFAEIVASALETREVEGARSSLLSAILESRQRKAIWLGTKAFHLVEAQAIFEELGFQKVTEELLMSKQL